MINNVVGINGGAPVQSLKGGVQQAPAPEAPARVSPETFLPSSSSRIRVDNYLDLAILEVRSQETGDIIRQYPTEKQIEAFQRAAELETTNEPVATSTVSEPAPASAASNSNNTTSRITVDIGGSVSSVTSASAPSAESSSQSVLV